MARLLVSPNHTLREICQPGDRTAATPSFGAPGLTNRLELCNVGVDFSKKGTATRSALRCAVDIDRLDRLTGGTHRRIWPLAVLLQWAAAATNT